MHIWLPNPDDNIQHPLIQFEEFKYLNSGTNGPMVCMVLNSWRYTSKWCFLRRKMRQTPFFPFSLSLSHRVLSLLKIGQRCCQAAVSTPVPEGFSAKAQHVHFPVSCPKGKLTKCQASIILDLIYWIGFKIFTSKTRGVPGTSVNCLFNQVWVTQKECHIRRPDMKWLGSDSVAPDVHTANS